MVSPETRMGKTGQINPSVGVCGALIMYADVDGQAIPPRWPPRPESLLVDEPIYDLTPIPLTSIAMVSSRSIKVGSTR